jgi:hypothetical protein
MTDDDRSLIEMSTLIVQAAVVDLAFHALNALRRAIQRIRGCMPSAKSDEH